MIMLEVSHSATLTEGQTKLAEKGVTKPDRFPKCSFQLN